MVHVKKVEIFGFKSFGFKNTTVQFEPGLVSISGPNGSGKSNILDAIIFAMGENKSRMMRVDKLRKLIHDVDNTRHGSRMARSSVHFDNKDRKIPVNSDTVQITREMNKDGENTYYLNKKKTNRGHILDILDMADAGLGNLNAIQQGTVTRISEFTSEEKRRSIEDLIGLSYFDEKKEEAEKQLDEADRRLQIAMVKMDDVKGRIDELDEERNQMLRHNMLTQEIHRYQAVDAANKIKSITEKKSEKNRSINEIKKELDVQIASKNDLNDKRSTLEKQKSELMTAANNYNSAKSSLDTKISASLEKHTTDTSKIKINKRRIEHIDERIPIIDGELDEIDHSLTDIDDQIQQKNISITNINSQNDDSKSVLKDINRKREQVLVQQSEMATKRHNIEKNIRESSRQKNQDELKHSKAKYEYDQASNKINAGITKLNNLKVAISDLYKSSDDLESIINTRTDTVNKAEVHIQRLYEKKTKANQDIKEINVILEKSNKATIQYESKIKVIQKLMHEDYTVAKLKDDASKIGIVGLVYEMITWDKTYERPIMAACSDWIKAIVVQDFATLLGIAEVAKNRNLPKLKIIPLDAIPPLDFTPPKRPGILGVLADYVRCDHTHTMLKTLLFGNIVLVDSRETAYAISQEGYKAVTVDGEYFEAEKGSVVIEINSKISKITKMISMSSDIDGLKVSMESIKKYLFRKAAYTTKLEESIKSNTNNITSLKTMLATTQENQSNLQFQIKSALSTKKTLETQITTLKSTVKTLFNNMSIYNDRIKTREEEIKITEKEYADADDTAITDELTRINNELMSAQRNHNNISEQHQNVSKEITNLQTKLTNKKFRQSTLVSEKNKLNVERNEIIKTIKDLESSLFSEEQIAKELRDQEQQLIANNGSSMVELKECDDQINIISQKERKLSLEISRKERQCDSLERDIQDLAINEIEQQKILDSYGKNVNVEMFDSSHILEELNAELKSLGVLNAKAPEAYVSVTDGYRSMSTRKNSLEEERNSIVSFIESIEKDKRQTFLDAFDKVDNEIRTTFNKMTGGGNAWLELENEDDIFSSGISYIIQFPDKPKRESISISGGEKTLAAIVFVLALQKLKPSPFYLFDEVDAHLDAPNSERLVKILEERAQNSQFIMVSLKDTVVQKANLVYGVFGKGGVSNVVVYRDKRIPPVRA